MVSLLAVLLDESKGKAFSGDTLWVDYLRLTCVMLGILLAFACARLYLIMHGHREAGISADPEKRWDYYVISLICFVLVAVFTEIGRMGAILTWRLPLNCVGLAFGIIAVRSTMSMRR